MRCVRVTVVASLSRELLKGQKIARLARYRVAFAYVNSIALGGGLFESPGFSEHLPSCVRSTGRRAVK